MDSVAALSTDRTFAGIFGAHVRRHLIDDTGEPLRQPTCSPEHAEFYATLAASYGRRALRETTRETSTEARGLIRYLGGLFR